MDEEFDFNSLPKEAKQLTEDGELYKIVIEEGDKSNRCTNYNDAAVAVQFFIQSENGVFFENGNKMTCWITGDKESEKGLYLFLPIVVRTMAEKETCKVLMTRKYIYGNTLLTNMKGEIDKSDVFQAVVHLFHAQHIDTVKLPGELIPLPAPESIQQDNAENEQQNAETSRQSNQNESENNIKDPSPTENNSNQNENQKDSNEKEKKEEETNDEKPKKQKKEKKKESQDQEALRVLKEIASEQQKLKEEMEKKMERDNVRRKVFALNQLTLADKIMEENKPAMARKEYNRAKISWTSQITLGNTPDTIDDERMNMEENEFKAYINAEASYGVARTFMAINPPNIEKAISSLQESLSLYRLEKAEWMLNDIQGNDPQAPLPPPKQTEPQPKMKHLTAMDPDDADLIRPQYWNDETIPMSSRFKFFEICKAKGKEHYNMKEFKAAMKYFNRARSVFNKSAYINADPNEVKQAKEAICICHNNASICEFMKGDPKAALVQADYALVIIEKELSDNTDLYIKSLYRKCSALIQLHEYEEADSVIKLMKEKNASQGLINKLEAEKKNAMNAEQRTSDFVFKKMSGK